MKKTIFTLVAFMLLGFSFVKAQSVTTFDLEFKKEEKGDFSSTQYFENTDSKISVRAYSPEKGSQDKFRVFLRGNEVKNLVLEVRGNYGNLEVYEARIGIRIHLVCFDRNRTKCVYAFFDDPRDEFIQKMKQKGF
ncbi:hypothetical protein AD998_14345 [bacterium 336/3]|nr:hypothetical protein AD998_14345 [bacterium 336/3]